MSAAVERYPVVVRHVSEAVEGGGMKFSDQIG